MGLLKHLLFWPVTGPTFLARFSIEKVNDSVRGELTSDEAVKEELLALQMQLELGEIEDEEYVAREAELMQRLRDVRHWREQFGMGVSGGPVRIARDEAEAAADPMPTTDDDGNGSAEGRVASPEGASVNLTFDLDPEA